MAVSGPPPVPDEATIPCKEANDALMYSLIGLVCFGIFLEPYAIWLSVKARRICAANPRFSGAGKATAALVIASVILALWVLGIFAQAFEAASRMR